MFRIRLDNLRLTLRELGFAQSVLYALHKVVSQLPGSRSGVFSYGFYCQPLQAGEGVDALQPVQPTHAPVSEFPRPQEIIQQRFAQEHLCFVVDVKDNFAGYAWFAEKAMLEDEVDCTYVLAAADMVWDYDVFVAPKYRIGRAFSRLWGGSAAYLTEQGYRRTLSRISRFNPDSLRAHARLGAERVGSAVFCRAFGVQLMFAAQAPYLSLTRSGGTRLEFD